MRLVTAFALMLAALLVTSAARPVSRADDPPKGKADGHDHKAGDVPKNVKAMNDKMVKYLGHKDADYEKRFIDLMIPHHEGAILSAKHALEHSNRPELKEMAKKAIEDQEKEIEKLKKWRKEWYGSEK
ncbi:MAG: DUF305 domain-containing protein [Gemmataceae bacterium]|nr:DUF305 domain-containing protein [Gemmataceae bacterium]